MSLLHGRTGSNSDIALIVLLIIYGFQNTESNSKMASDLKKVKEVQVVADANTLFSASLHGVLKKTNPDNLIFSAFSVSAVSAMLKLGARGQTATEVAKAFNFPSDDEILSKGYSQVLPALQQSNEGFTLSAANRLYCKVGFELKPEFTQAIKKTFNGEIEQLDFGKKVEAAKKINDWVEVITKNKIKDLISPDNLNANTVIVLVNGVYFKGLWKEKFDPQNTSKAKFYVNAKESVQVDMMFLQNIKFPYVNLPDLDAHAVALPYKGDRLSMIIYLPKQNNGLTKVEAGLKNLKPNSLLEKMTTRAEIELSLPRFKIESTLDLVDPLKKLGIQTLFTEAADLSGMPKTPASLAVSAVVQKAFIEVNEEGTEAAAATGMMIMLLSMPQIIQFKVDHPFAYQIVDSYTNFILFAGSVSSPKSG